MFLCIISADYELWGQQPNESGIKALTHAVIVIRLQGVARVEVCNTWKKRRMKPAEHRKCNIMGHNIGPICSFRTHTHTHKCELALLVFVMLCSCVETDGECVRFSFQAKAKLTSPLAAASNCTDHLFSVSYVLSEGQVYFHSVCFLVPFVHLCSFHERLFIYLFFF